MFGKIIKVIKNPYCFLNAIVYYIPFINKRISDEIYLKIRYKSTFGVSLNLENPITFNEKLQWLKLYDRKEIYKQMVDKYEVRKLIKERIGDEYLIPLLGIWDNFDEIDFDNLPNEFVLKTTHDSGGIIICKDKTIFDKKNAKKILNKHLKTNYFYLSREWPYMDVKPRIICEKKIGNKDESPADYKFMCFDGKVKVIQIHKGRYKSHRQYHYDENGNLLNFNNIGYSNEGAEKLDMNLINKMIKIAEILSKDLCHVRVDLYNENNRIYFGEITFYDAAGFEPWTNGGDLYLGKLINLESAKKLNI